MCSQLLAPTHEGKFPFEHQYTGSASFLKGKVRMIELREEDSDSTDPRLNPRSDYDFSVEFAKRNPKDFLKVYERLLCNQVQVNINEVRNSVNRIDSGTLRDGLRQNALHLSILKHRITEICEKAGLLTPADVERRGMAAWRAMEKDEWEMHSQTAHSAYECDIDSNGNLRILKKPKFDQVSSAFEHPAVVPSQGRYPADAHPVEPYGGPYDPNQFLRLNSKLPLEALVPWNPKDETLEAMLVFPQGPDSVGLPGTSSGHNNSQWT